MRDWATTAREIEAIGILQERDDLRVKVEQYRAALQRIAAEDPYNDNGHHFVNMATEALLSINRQTKIVHR